MGRVLDEGSLYTDDSGVAKAAAPALARIPRTASSSSSSMCLLLEGENDLGAENSTIFDFEGEGSSDARVMSVSVSNSASASPLGLRERCRDLPRLAPLDLRLRGRFESDEILLGLGGVANPICLTASPFRSSARW